MPDQRTSTYKPDATRMLAIGLMSGTSADGVDAALLRTDGQDDIEFIDAVTLVYETTLRDALLEVAKHDIPLSSLLRLEGALTAAHVDACETLLRKTSDRVSRKDVAIIGFHGHTIRHIGSEQLTWQLGDPSSLAERMSIPVVSDFRRRDLAAGGQGAPLAPLFHQRLVAEVTKPTLVLNLGGVANITWIGTQGELLAGDAGPGCGLLDVWTMRTTGQPCDQRGRLASQGTVDQGIVEAALAADFFSKPLPKSADRYDFDDIDVRSLNPPDGAATLCAVTAAAINNCVRSLPQPPCSVWVTGGGVHHPLLMRLLGDRLPNVRSIEELGQRPDSLEAECFAWLGVRRVLGLSTTVPQTTGCQAATCGGTLTT